MLQIAPSILSCDFARLKEEIDKVYEAGADLIHVDVMDGHFVPNISIGVPVVKSLKKITKLPLDVHLMISDPLFYCEEFIKSGADILTFHHESNSDTLETIKKIKSLNCKVGLSVKPKTDVKEIFKYLDLIDMVLIMTVEPGFGGQSFMSDMLPKITTLKNEISKRNLNIDIEVDGGISQDTSKLVVDAGANILVAGSAIFGKENYKYQIDSIKLAALGGEK